MNIKNRQMSLGAFLSSFGHHLAAWRCSGSEAKGFIDMAFYKHVAQTAERGKMDMLFFADGVSIPSVKDVGTNLTYLFPEATSMLSALSAVTEHIGLAATVSTTFNEPYNVARRFSTLDHLSGGRAAWNVVTSTKGAEARNFGSDQLMEHGLRYERAKEFLDVVTALWDSWEDEALLFDKESGIFADTQRIHAISHRGESFSVEGPLNIPRSPQGRPVIIEAGTSESGQRLAAQTAEVVFTAFEDKEEAKAYYSKLKALLPEYGRSGEDLKVMPGLLTFIGETEEEAKEKEAICNELLLPATGVAFLSLLMNFDLSGYPIDEPLPEVPLSGNTSGAYRVMKLAREKGLTIRELSKHFAVARGFLTIRGTPEQIADRMEDWFVSCACDGFNVMPPYLPDGLDEFVDKVIPLLRQRGIFRTEYSGRTLREHLGLKRPASKFRATVGN